MEPTEPAAPPAFTPTETTTPADPEAPDLRITVVFDKPSYFGHEVIIARATVRNAGTAAATGVGVTSTGNIDSNFWHGFGSSGPTLEPGQAAEGQASGFMTNADDGAVELVVTVGSAEPDADPTDNTVTVSVPVIVLRGNYAGTVYGDRNGSATMDPGEELAGLTMTISGGSPQSGFTTTTDAAGRFAFHRLPTGRYWVHFYETRDWSFGYHSVEVDEVDDPDDLVRGAGLVDELISASAVFTESTYAPGDIPRMTLRVTNGGAVVVRGLTASCWVSGGELIDSGELGRESGVLVPARSTKTFELAFQIGQQGAAAGHMQVTCILGAPPNVNGSVRTVAVARVPNSQAVALVVGRLWHYGRPTATCMSIMCTPRSLLPGKKVYLRNQVTGQIVARSVTESDGIFRFHNVLPDLYDFVVVGPWTPTTLAVRSDATFPYDVLVFSGPEQPDPDTDPPTTGAPAPADAPPQAGLTPAELATTGADIRWLALGGLLTLALGTGLITGVRRIRIPGSGGAVR